MAILPSDFRESEFMNTIWTASVSHEISLADLQRPEFWVHVASTGRMKLGDEIRVIPAGLAFFLRLLVIDAGKFGAKVHILQHEIIKENSKTAQDQPSGEYEIKLRGPRKWCVLRASDKEIVIEGLATRVDAESWLTSHTKAMAA